MSNFFVLFKTFFPLILASLCWFSAENHPQSYTKSQKIKTPKEVVKLLNEIPKKTTLFIRPVLLEEIIQKVENEYFIK